MPGPSGCTASTCSAAAINVSTIDVVSPVSAPCTVTPTTAPDSRSTACSALSARCVRPSFIFATQAGRETVSSVFGARFELVSVVATFERAAVLGIAERSDLDVLAIAAGQEFTCNLADTPGILRGYRLGSSRWTSIAACVGR